MRVNPGTWCCGGLRLGNPGAEGFDDAGGRPFCAAFDSVCTASTGVASEVELLSKIEAIQDSMGQALRTDFDALYQREVRELHVTW